MVDFSDLAIFRYAPALPEHQAYAKTASREFMMGYLRHFCRLSENMEKTGTIPVLKALLDVEPDDGELHFLLGQQYERDSQLDEALESLERAANLRLDKPTYMLAAVRVACRLGDGTRGLAMASGVISLYPIMAEAYYERGLIYEVDENWDRALRDYEMCHRLEPNNPRYLCATASIYRRKKNYSLARRDLEKALKINPRFVPAQEELSRLPMLGLYKDWFRSRSDESNSTSPNGFSSKYF